MILLQYFVRSNMFVYFFQVIFNSLWINDSLNHVMIHYIITKYSSANFSMVKFLVKEKRFITNQNLLWRSETTKIKELKFKMLLSRLPFFITKTGLGNGVRKYITMKVSKKQVRLQTPLAFVRMSVWTIWLARNMSLTKIWFLTFLAQADYWLK